jgi:hypothetical protein
MNAVLLRSYQLILIPLEVVKEKSRGFVNELLSTCLGNPPNNHRNQK